MTELSVVIPARDAAHVLANQLQALASERPDFDWEVIVVDNASEDDTSEVAGAFASSLPIRVVSELVPGRHHACNRGVDVAKADFIAFVDADDVVVSGYVPAMHSALERSGVVAGRLAHAADPEEDVQFGNVQSSGLMPSLGFLPYATGGNFGVHRESFLAVGGFESDIPYGEDVDLSWRLLLAGEQIRFEPNAEVRVHQRGDLRQMFTQHRRFGIAHALLYAKYAKHGMPRRPWAEVRRDWQASVAALPHLGDAHVRARWVRRTSRSIGRIQGSLRTRQLYL